MSAKTKKQEELKNLVILAQAQGKVKNQKEFAKMIQLDEGYLSQLLNGSKRITDQMRKSYLETLARSSRKWVSSAWRTWSSYALRICR